MVRSIRSWHEAFQLGARECEGQVFRTCRVHRDERLVDLGRLRSGELDFGFFSRIAQALQRHLVFAQDRCHALF